MDEGLMTEAKDEFMKVLSIKVKHGYADVHNNLGVAYEMSGNFENAHPLLQERYRHKSPATPKAHFNLGNTYSTLERYEEAVEEYKTGLSTYSRDGPML